MNIVKLFRILGPGMLFAGAAIGGSHLIQATRAGAMYNFSLLWLILLINLIKFPFFEIAFRYTSIKGEDLLVGYLKTGRWILFLFFVLSLITSVGNIAALTMATGALCHFMTGIPLSETVWGGVLLGCCFLLLVRGGYQWLEKIIKGMVLSLAMITLIAVGAAFFSYQPSSVVAVPSFWDTVGISFIIALMGWMPAPLEASVWTSLWLEEHARTSKNHTLSLRSSLLDFRVSYIITTVLALVFATLGALIMFGSGESLESSGIGFANQLIGMYTKTLGPWSFWVISLGAFAALFSSLFSVTDAYPRSLMKAHSLWYGGLGAARENVLYWIYLTVICVVSFLVVVFIAENMSAMLDVATIISFLVAPFLAYLNYRVVTSEHFRQEDEMPLYEKLCYWVGMLFLLGFSLLFMHFRILQPT